MKHCVWVLLIGFAPEFCGATELSVPVRVLGRPANRAGRANKQATVGSLSPQYQALPSVQAADLATSDDPKWRFVVALPEGFVLVEATVWIDGVPYRQKREDRIKKLLQQRADAPSTAEVVQRSEESRAAAEAKDSNISRIGTAGGTAAKVLRESDSDEPKPETSVSEQLGKYATATGRWPTPNELRWLLSRWWEGPPLLLLEDSFARVRAAQTPVFLVLDRDHDQMVSMAEMKAAATTLAACDTNDDDLVSEAEIVAAARLSSTRLDVWDMRPLMIGLDRGRSPADATTAPMDTAPKDTAPKDTAPIDTAPIDTAPIDTAPIDAGALPAGVWNGSLHRLDLNGEGRLDADEMTEFLTATPDLQLEVSFQSQAPKESRLKVLHVSQRMIDAENPPVARRAAITLFWGGAQLEFSAVQALAETGSDQVSVGAVNDGYPLWPVLDLRQDGRLTVRELRQVSSHLATLDRDGDGAIQAAEVTPTVRVSFGLGPTVHRHLSKVRSVHPPPPRPQVEVPGWFTRMDKNGDDDLTAREFLGTPEQFEQFDKDQDGLIDPLEAVESTPPSANYEGMEEQQRQTPNQDGPSSDRADLQGEDPTLETASEVLDSEATVPDTRSKSPSGADAGRP